MNNAIASLYVNEATVSLIEPLVIPDVFSKCSELNPSYSFLASAERYSQYYTDLERSYGQKITFQHPAEIPNLGLLTPLSKRHALNSYWRHFRLTIKKLSLQGVNAKALFLLLPLMIDLPAKRLSVNGQSLPAKVSAYLFPFGAVVVTLDVKVRDKNITDFVNIVRNIKGANISTVPSGAAEAASNESFSKLSRDLAVQIDKALFSGNERALSEFSAHTYVFIKKTNTTLRDFSNPHLRVIASLIRGQRIEDLMLPTEAEIKAFLKTKIKKFLPGEILVFDTKGTFVYPDADWLQEKESKQTQSGAKKKSAVKSADCMRDNYESCLNALFAINRFLAVAAPFTQAGIDHNRVDELKQALKLAFYPDDPEFCYDHVFAAVSTSIGLDKLLQGVK